MENAAGYRAPVTLRYFLVGTAVHVAAAAIYAVLAQLRLEGCDIADGRGFALFLASAADLVLAVIVARVTRPSNRSHYRRAMLGWALSYVLAIVASCAVVQSINALPSGCGS